MGTTRQVLFGAYTVDVDTRELLRTADRSRVHLSPKAFELLLVLLGERPRAVAKRELHERLWPDTFISDATLASTISEVREALGERGRDARYVRTVHGFGYAFSAEARETAGPRSVSVNHWLICDGREQSLIPGTHIIGRDISASIPLCSPTVSRQHAKVIVDGGGVVLEDLGSKNGTYVQGRVITSPIRLADGDELKIGAFTLMFRTLTADSQTETS